MSQNKILAELANLVKKASDQKEAVLRKESESISAALDSADDGTRSASTGEQAAAQITAQKEQYADPANDVGANASENGESVDMSTDEATAVSPDGKSGTEGGELAAGGISKADNGDEDTDSPSNSGFNSGAFKGAAEQCRTMAADLRKTAQALITPFDKFLIKAARATDNTELKKTAQEMDDMALADAAAGSLEEQLQSGELGDEEALQILEEALASGAITEEDVAAAAEAVGGAGGAPIDPMGEAPADPMGEGAADPMGGMMGPEAEEGMMEAKLAAAHIDPSHPEYIKKLATLYPTEIQQGYAFAMKLAEEMSSEFEEEAPEEAVLEGEPVGQELKEVTAIEGVPEEVGVGEEEGEVSEEGAVEGTLEDDLTPTTPEEEAALGAVGGELGMEEEALAQLLGAPLPPEAGVELGKVAKALKLAGVSPTSRYRALLIEKVAALRQ